MAIFSVHAGHGASNSKSCGAIGLINESDEARKVKDELIRLLRGEGHTVYDTTVDYPDSSKDCLNKVVKNCNQFKTDLDISVHFNAGANDKKGNKTTTGTEIFCHNPFSSAVKYAKRTTKKISELGYKNRGVKYSLNLAVLKTKNPCMLIECCFVDDFDDVALYNYKTMAKAIAEGILDKEISEKTILEQFKNGDYNGRKAKVTASSLNVRYDRGTEYDIVAKLPKETVVELGWVINGWAAIYNYKGNKGFGYVNTKYLELI